MATEEPSVMKLNILVDRESNRLAFAEADKDFVDILFSFLTLPMGTIVRLLQKQSMVGSIDNLYKSVENLEVRFFQTETCKIMLLTTRNSNPMNARS
ncbi:hypothetical protein IFM89_009937 [Coptis chinensis]|uniref:DUF674 family protein n=1 Tax=Coptis chinensis TaxID=261450 RepID=A0A835LLX7_9MAGN|nr:hypothetical protein IFM89_009937 [Coptis chinensis]